MDQIYRGYAHQTIMEVHHHIGLTALTIKRSHGQDTITEHVMHYEKNIKALILALGLLQVVGTVKVHTFEVKPNNTIISILSE